MDKIKSTYISMKVEWTATFLLLRNLYDNLCNSGKKRTHLFYS